MPEFIAIGMERYVGRARAIVRVEFVGEGGRGCCCC